MNNNSTCGYMAVSEEDEICKNWQSYKGFTVRPSPSSESHYAMILKKYATTRSRVVVLGGTPEIRNCIQGLQLNVTLIDRSAAMVRAMGLLTSAQTHIARNESFIQMDWLDLSTKSLSADIVLADDSINMLRWDQFEELIVAVHSSLSDGGWFACRLLLQPRAAYIEQSTEDVIRDFENEKIISIYDYASRINFASYDLQTFQMGWQNSIACLNSLLRNGKIKTDHGFISRFLHCNSVFACPPKDEWEKLVIQYFDVCEIFYPTEHDYCQFEPLYLLRKRET